MPQDLPSKTVNESLTYNIITPVQHTRQAVHMAGQMDAIGCLLLHVSKAVFFFLLLWQLAQMKKHFHQHLNSSLIASVVIIIFFLTGFLHNCCEAYNVGLLKAKIFSGPSREQFGYAVQQFINEQGKW